MVDGPSDSLKPSDPLLPSGYLCERDLDRAAVPNWRNRLAAARSKGPPYDEFDLELKAVRAEYRRLEAARIAGTTAPELELDLRDEEPF